MPQRDESVTSYSHYTPSGCFLLANGSFFQQIFIKHLTLFETLFPEQFIRELKNNVVTAEFLFWYRETENKLRNNVVYTLLSGGAPSVVRPARVLAAFFYPGPPGEEP